MILTVNLLPHSQQPMRCTAHMYSTIIGFSEATLLKSRPASRDLGWKTSSSSLSIICLLGNQVRPIDSHESGIDQSRRIVTDVCGAMPLTSHKR